MQDEVQTVEVEDTRVGCDGGGGALGHPLVYLTVEAGTVTECPYCSRRFVLKAGARVHGHH